MTPGGCSFGATAGPSNEWPRLLLPWIGFPPELVAWNRVSPLLAFLHLIGRHVEADFVRIEVAKTHAELLGTLCRGRQHPIERGHRTVVEIGCGRPDAVERARAIVQASPTGFGQFFRTQKHLLCASSFGMLWSSIHFLLNRSTAVISAIEYGMLVEE